MSNIIRIGLATALVIGSASVALAQSYEAPQPARPSDGYSGRQLSAGDRSNVGQSTPYNYYEITSPDQPWNTLMEPGNTSGGD
jgi:hypothetical protein